MNLLLLHGFLGTPSTWDAVAPGTAGMLLPGHGPEPDMTATSFEAVVDAIAASLAGPVVVAGHSMGARVALGLAVAHPRLVRAAVLSSVNPGLAEGERSERVAWEDAQAAAILAHGLPAFVDGWERLPLFTTQKGLPEERRAAERSRRLSHTREGAAWAVRTLGLGRQPSYWAALASSTVPITFLAGANDAKFAELGFRASRIAPRSTLQVIPGAGHNLALEAPAAFTAAIAAYDALPTEETHP